MLCSYCNTNRPANDAPCPNCGAPSSQVGQGWDNNGWSNVSVANPWNQPVQQLSFEESADPAGWGGDSSSQNSPVSEQRSLVPVSSFQGDAYGLQAVQQQEYDIIHAPQVEPMLPALPDDATYVPPMYTKPRPIIPRYRIISGLLSVIIVTILACGGLSFYAKSSGMLHNLRVAMAGGPPPSLNAAQDQKFPDPKDQPDKGPAFDAIPIAATTTRVDEKNFSPLDPQKVFKPGQQFYLTYSILPHAQQGTVVIKWYTNNNLYNAMPPDKEVGKPSLQSSTQAYVKIGYAQAAEGKVEIYWNDKLAQALYFVVRP